MHINTQTRSRSRARPCTHSQSQTPYVFYFFSGCAKSLTESERGKETVEKGKKRLKIRATACFWRKFETVRFLCALVGAERRYENENVFRWIFFHVFVIRFGFLCGIERERRLFCFFISYSESELII